MTKNKAVVVTVSGTASVPGTELKDIKFSGTLSLQRPDLQRQEFSFSVAGTEATQGLVYTGQAGKGWVSVNGKATEMGKLPEAIRKEYRQRVHAEWAFGQLARLKDDKVFKLAPLAEIEVGGQPAVGVQVSREGYRDVKLYFDRQTHLLVKQAYQSPDFKGGTLLAETLFSGHRKVGGVMTPKQMVIRRDGEAYMTAEVTDLVASESLPEGRSTGRDRPATGEPTNP